MNELEVNVEDELFLVKYTPEYIDNYNGEWGYYAQLRSVFDSKGNELELQEMEDIFYDKLQHQAQDSLNGYLDEL